MFGVDAGCNFVNYSYGLLARMSVDIGVDGQSCGIFSPNWALSFLEVILVVGLPSYWAHLEYLVCATLLRKATGRHYFLPAMEFFNLDCRALDGAQHMPIGVRGIVFDKHRVFIFPQSALAVGVLAVLLRGPVLRTLSRAVECAL